MQPRFAFTRSLSLSLAPTRLIWTALGWWHGVWYMLYVRGIVYEYGMVSRHTHVCLILQTKQISPHKTKTLDLILQNKHKNRFAIFLYFFVFSSCAFSFRSSYVFFFVPFP